ncbi:uncharacterized protein zgc:113184 [Solea solea]|uniref:uncharacterized protein zgc:113184 n=1 Tax=Solea solea TaxID=90069 RepID=UPI00272DB9B4|nr:uncharacterized protein zgc:113184 [Solea solea]
MEEAYSELYQQFLRMRLLCLRQAALLHKLTAALQKQQGATVPNGELSDLMSIPVQCTQEIPLFFHEKPQPVTATALNPEAQCGIDGLPGNFGTWSDLLAEDMSKLGVNLPQWRKECGTLEHFVAPMSTLDSARWQGASSTESKTAGQVGRPSRDRCLHKMMMPLSDGISQGNDFLGQSDGLLLSDVALQSHVCNFCQAVFPGDTTTKGEFLQHLHTHIT